MTEAKMISVISSIIIWGCLALILFRSVSASGIQIPAGNKAVSFILADKRRGLSDNITIKSVLLVCAGALAFRIIVFALSALAVAMFDNSDMTFSSFFKHYIQWDVNNYQRIADLGYKGYNEDGKFTTLAFLPLYPWVARVLSIFTQNTYAALLSISFICYSAGCGVLYKLCSIDFGKSTALKAVVLISVFPHGLFFGTMMNESMFFMFTVITLYFIRRHNWWLVGIFGALTSLTRLAGLALAFPALIEFIEHYEICGRLRQKKFGEVLKLFLTKGSPVCIMLIGTFIYLYCNYRTSGDWFKFLEYQQTVWNHHSTYFGTGISNVFKNLRGHGNSMMKAAVHIPSVISLLFVAAALIYGIRRSRNMYGVYLIVYIMVNMSVDWIISTPRYMACAVPAFIFLAEFTDRHKRSYSLITAVMAIGFGIYLTAYLFSKQIL